jgi:hypothetical protein
MAQAGDVSDLVEKTGEIIASILPEDGRRWHARFCASPTT